jgi:TP901 family phage tail tape measure protein
MAIFIPLVTKFDDRGLSGAKRALANFQNFAVDVGRVAATAIAAVGVASVREAAQFETSLSKIQGLVGVSTDEIVELANAARRLGPEFGVSANEAADALFFITSAGLRGAGATEVLEASLKGAAIGLGDTKTIADLATSAVNAYGESNLGGAEAVDVLAEAVRLGKLAPEELAGAMGQVLPLASNLGVRFDEVGAAMAGMSKTGTDASTAATQLRQILATIAKPTAEADKALANMGLSAEGLRDQIKQEGLFATLETLTDAFDGNIEATTEVFGNIRALSGVLDLMGASVDDNRELFKLMADDTGVLNEAFEITAETAQFKFDSAMATAKDTLIEIGATLLDRLLPYLDEFKAFMDQNGPTIAEAFDNIFEFVNKVGEKLAELGEAFLPKVMELMNNEQFQENVQRLGENFFLIADQVIRFVESDLGQFLLDLTGASIIGGLELLNEQLERLANLMFVVQEAMDIFSGKAPSVDFETLMDRAGSVIGIRLSELAQYFLNLQASTTINPSRRAGGGPVSSGNSFLVGEMGPELFVPSAGGGRIVPNDKLGGGTNITINVNAGMGANGSQIGEQIVTAIKRYERTSGPVFASA